MLLSGRATLTIERFSEQELVEQRPVLYRYALLQVRDSEVADDLVQETLLAALQAATSFEAKACLRTWLIGILKHKIADHWRRTARIAAISIPEAVDDSDNDSDLDDFFVSDGHWSHNLKSWGDPEAALKQLEFWTIFEACQSNLPPKMAQVFMLRELVGMEAPEICHEVGITDANYWVTLHRARVRLRECLEIRWFNNTKRGRSNA